MCTSARAAWCEERDASGAELPWAHQDPAFQQLYREGNEAFKQKRWSDAELKYLKAWGLVRSFDIAANLGEVQLQLNKPRSAATFLSFALRTAPPSTKPEQLARIRHFLGEAKAQVGTLRVRAMNVAEVEVYLDGERVPEEAARHELYLEPGEHVLLMRHAGYEDAVLRVITGPGLTETIAHRLKPKAEKAPGAAGAGAAGAPAAAGPRAGNDAPPAKLPETTAAPREARSWVPVIALGAASAVGLGLGVGFTVASNGASADAHAQREAILRDGPGCLNASGAVAERCAQFSRTMARSDRFRDMAGVTFIASGTVALAALAVALWPQSGRTQVSAVRVIPELRGDSTGLSLFGAWQ